MSTAGGGGNIVTDGLVLCLDAANPRSFISGSTIWNDLTKNLNSGSLVNGPTFNSSNGGSFVFDGVDDYSNISNPINNTMNTISIYVNMQSINVCPIVYYGADSFDSGSWTWGIAVFPSNTHGFNESPLNYPTTSLYTESVSVGTWKNFTLVRNDNGDTKLYKNGVLVGTKVGSGTTSLRNSGDRLYIAKAGSTYGNFNLGNILIYNKSLSSSEVLQNYNATKSRFGL